MAFPTGLPKVRYHGEHFNERTGMCYHQAPPLVRVVAHGGDAGQAKPHLEHNPLSLLETYHAMPLRKLNDPASPRSGFCPFFSAMLQAQRDPPLATCAVFIAVGWCIQCDCTTHFLRVCRHRDGGDREYGE